MLRPGPRRQSEIGTPGLSMDTCSDTLSPETDVSYTSTCQQHAFAKEVEGAAAIHLAFDQFEPVDVAFDRTRTPMHSEAGVHRLPITVKVAAEAAKLRRTGALNIGDPVLEVGSTSLADQDHKTLRQAPAGSQFAAAATQISQERAFCAIELRPAAQQEPAQRLRTGQDASNGWWRLRLAPTLHETSDRSLAAAIPECFELFV